MCKMVTMLLAQSLKAFQVYGVATGGTNPNSEWDRDPETHHHGSQHLQSMRSHLMLDTDPSRARIQFRSCTSYVGALATLLNISCFFDMYEWKHIIPGKYYSMQVAFMSSQRAESLSPQFEHWGWLFTELANGTAQIQQSCSTPRASKVELSRKRSLL